jgi:ubiquinone/menaquinone biosynthesis C-methylase UbiE
MPSPPPLTPLASAALRVPAPERALEVECGDGDGVLFLAREFPAARVRGVDRSPEAVRRAVARVGLDPEGRVAFKHGKPRSLPYPDDMFDLVAQTRGSLHPKEVVRVLRAGGHLIYVESPRWPLRPRPRNLRRGLERLGFEQAEIGEADGCSYFVGRLRGTEPLGQE